MLRNTLLLAALLGVACGEKDDGDDTAPSTDDTAPTGDDSDEPDDSAVDDTGDGYTECRDEMDANASLSGQVVDASGSPIPNASVQLCWKVCRQQNVDAQGNFEFPAAEARTHALKVFPSGWIEGDTAVFSLPVGLSEGANSVTVALPDYSTSYQTIPATGGAELNLDGLLVTASLDNLTFDFGVDTDQANGVQLPAELWPDWQLPAEVTGSVAGAWFTHPYNTVATEPMPVRVEAPEGDHANYGLWESHWHVESCEVKWEKAGTLTRDGDYLVNPEIGLHKFTTVLIVEE